MINKQQMLDLLKADVVPALGCTEPVCVALCAATAGKVVEGEILSIHVEANSGIYKNGMSAGIPGCTEVGLDHAAALGALLKNPEKGLQLLEDITPEILSSHDALIRNQAVKVEWNTEEKSLYVKCTICTADHKVICVTRDAHTNIVLLVKDDEILFEKTETASGGGENIVLDELKAMKVAEIRALVDTASEEELLFMLDGVEMNEKLAAYSQNNPCGVGIADAFRKTIGGSLLSGDLMSRIIQKVSSAAESRLDGCPLPTMSSSGAGTKGLVVILPVSETAEVIGASTEKKVRAIAFAHLMNRYINMYIGKLSPMCSCVMSSSTAAAVGIAYLLGANDEQIGHTIRNMAGTVTGMICDGGKVGCAMKASTGSAAALMSAITAVNGAPLRVSDGICAETPEDCIRNMASIGINGMAQTDGEILRIMTSK